MTDVVVHGVGTGPRSLARPSLPVVEQALAAYLFEAQVTVQ